LGHAADSTQLAAPISPPRFANTEQYAARYEASSESPDATPGTQEDTTRRKEGKEYLDFQNAKSYVGATREIL